MSKITGQSGFVYDKDGFLSIQVAEQVNTIDDNVEQIKQFLLQQQRMTAHDLKSQVIQQQALQRMVEQQDVQIINHQQIRRSIDSVRTISQNQVRTLDNLLNESKKQTYAVQKSHQGQIINHNALERAIKENTATTRRMRVSEPAHQVKHTHEPKAHSTKSVNTARDSQGRFTAQPVSQVSKLADAIRHANFNMGDSSSIDPSIDAIREIGDLFRPVGKMASLAFKPLSAMAKLRKRNEPLPKEEVEHNRKQIKLLERIADNILRSKDGLLSKLARALGLGGAGGGLDVDIGGKGKKGRNTSGEGVSLPDMPDSDKNRQGKKDKWYKGLGKYGKAGGLGVALGALGFLDWNEQSIQEKGATVGNFAGGIAGFAGGAMAGATVGSVVPIVGTTAGAIIGGMLGGWGGGSLGEVVGENVAPYIDQWTQKLIAYNLPEKMLHTFAVPMVGVVSALSTAVGSLGTLANNSFNVISNHIQNVVSTVKNLSSEIFDKVSKGVGQVLSSMANLVPESVKNVASNVGGVVTGAYSSAVGATSSVMEKVANGYNSAVDWTSRNVIERGANAVNSINTSIRETLGKSVAYTGTAQELHNQAKSKGLFKGATTVDGGLGHQGTYAGLMNSKNVIGSNFKWSAAVNDGYHKRKSPNSKHTQGLAYDVTLKDFGNGKSTKAVQELVNYYQSMGLSVSAKAQGFKGASNKTDVMIIDEHLFPSSKSTGSHLHVQFNSKESANKYYQAQATGIKASPTLETNAHQMAQIPMMNTMLTAGQKAGMSNSAKTSANMAQAKMHHQLKNNNKYDSIMSEVYSKYGFTAQEQAILKTQIAQESRFDPTARSHVGAMGLAQIMPATAKQFGVSNAYDPRQAIEGQAKIMRDLLKHSGGNWNQALAFYNAGKGSTDANTRFNKVMGYKETRQYVENILANVPNISLNGVTGQIAQTMGDTASQVASMSTGAVGAMAGLAGMAGAGIAGMVNPLLLLPFGEVKARYGTAKVTQPPSLPSPPKANDLQVASVKEPLNTAKPLEVKVTNTSNEIIGQNISDRTLAHAITGGVGERIV